jgi:hypothetical protein
LTAQASPGALSGGSSCAGGVALRPSVNNSNTIGIDNCTH